MGKNKNPRRFCNSCTFMSIKNKCCKCPENETLKLAIIDLIDSLDIGAMTYPGVAEAVQKAKDALK